MSELTSILLHPLRVTSTSSSSSLQFDIEEIREALDEIKAGAEFKTAASGFHALAMTKRKNSSS